MKCPKCHFDNPRDTHFCGYCAAQLPSSEGPAVSQTEAYHHPLRELAVGTTFAGRYLIIQELGEGGMGRVYEALDRELNEKVALKLIRPEIAVDDRTIQRFRNELKLARKISHKNVCRMFDLNKDGDTHFITMEFVSGEDLKSSIRRVGPLSVRKALAIAKQICEGLEEAHRQGIIHRDLKPRNIMIDQDGNARIMDFGIAHSPTTRGVTEDGHVVGTLEYMSPEQLEGQQADERSDIYSLGVILYEMVTGRMPFEGQTPLSIAAKHISAIPAAPRSVNEHIPDSLSRVIMKCLEKARERRFQTAAALLAELDKIEKTIPQTKTVSAGRRAHASERNMIRGLRKFAIPSLGVLAMGVTALVIWLVLLRPPTPAPAPPPASEIDIETMFLDGESHREQKDYPEALSRFRQILARQPDHFGAQFGLASILYEQGKTDEAVPEFEKAIALDKAAPDPYRYLGNLFEQKKDLAKSLHYYRQYLDSAPRATDSSDVEKKIRRIESALQNTTMQNTKPDQPRGREEPQDALPTLLKAGSDAFEAKKAQLAEDLKGRLSRVREAFEQKDYTGCILEARKALDLDRENAEARDYLNRSYLNLAPDQVNRMVHQYVQALDEGTLLDFYQRHCSPEVAQKAQKDIELILRLYDRIKSVASNITIRFKENDQAEVTFANVTTAERRADGLQQVIFEGSYVWDIVRRDDRWEIVRIQTQLVEKK